MAEESIDEGEFWLPPRFLDDDLPTCHEYEEDPMKNMAGLAFHEYGKFDRHRHGIGGDCGPWKKALCPEAMHMPWCWAESTIRAGNAPVKMSEPGAVPHWGTGKFYRHRTFSQRQFPATHSLIQHRMTQQQFSAWGLLYPHVVANSHGGLIGQELALPQVHPKNHHESHQPAAQSGTMNAVFIGAPVMRQCTGTGVFFPRQAGSRPEHKRRGFFQSPVLVPAKVVQSLNLKFEKMGPRPKQQPLSRSNDYIYRRCCTSTKNDGVNRMMGKCCAEPRPAVNHETINLPLEWTY